MVSLPKPSPKNSKDDIKNRALITLPHCIEEAILNIHKSPLFTIAVSNHRIKTQKTTLTDCAAFDGNAFVLITAAILCD